MSAPAPAPAPAPTRSPEFVFEWAPHSAAARAPPPARRLSPDFSPPLIAMVAVLATALLIVLYARILSRHLRRWRRRRRLLRSTAPPSPDNDDDDDLYASSDYFLCPYGLDDSAIRTLPLSLFSPRSNRNHECAVCLLEFQPKDTLRTLPLCAHSFHVTCIDVWLRSHATCPLCRAVVFRLDSPFVPMRAARIRHSLDEDLLLLAAAPPEILHRNFLKRSYSFGFERSLAPLEAAATATASPWRQRGFWSKRWPSPFPGSSSSRTGRVFSFRSHRVNTSLTIKSPAFFRRFLPLSSVEMLPVSRRRSRSMASPLAVYGRGQASSRMRCGDPEALLSPERLNRR